MQCYFCSSVKKNFGGGGAFLAPHGKDLKWACTKCLSKNCSLCLMCREYFPTKEGIVTLASTACCEKHLIGIHNYTYKPDILRFIGCKAEGFPVGIELEVSQERDNYELVPLAQKVELMSGGALFCKRDSSIHRGFEIVSHPININHILNDKRIIKKFKFSDLFKFLELNGMRGDETCGLHVHIDLNVFKPKNSSRSIGGNREEITHRYRFISLFLLNEHHMFQISGRTNLERFKFYAGCNIHESIEDIVITGKKRERHAIVNLTPATIEVRLFQATLDHAKFIEMLTFIKGAIEFTREFRNSKFTSDIRNFRDYLKTNYPLKWEILSNV